MLDFDENKYAREFGNNFRKVRKSKKFTQERLANEINSDISYISRIERGILNVTVIKLKIISKALSVPIEVFFDFQTKT